MSRTSQLISSPLHFCGKYRKYPLSIFYFDFSITSEDDVAQRVVFDMRVAEQIKLNHTADLILTHIPL